MLRPAVLLPPHLPGLDQGRLGAERTAYSKVENDTPVEVPEGISEPSTKSQPSVSEGAQAR
jgi:hypothetical protein